MNEENKVFIVCLAVISICVTIVLCTMVYYDHEKAALKLDRFEEIELRLKEIE